MPEHDMSTESELTFDLTALFDLFSLTLNKIQKPYVISFNFFMEFIVNNQRKSSMKIPSRKEAEN